MPTLPEVPERKKFVFKQNKNIITIKGRSYKRHDILVFKRHFDEICSDRSGQMTLEDYVKSVSGNSHLKRIAISLFSFLDEGNRGTINFEE